MDKSLSPSLVGEYQICQRRGHTTARAAGNNSPISHAGFFVCKYCGTHYRLLDVPTLEEKNIPTAGEAVCPPS